MTDAKGQDAIDAGKGLNFSIDLYASLNHGNISNIYGGHMSIILPGEPREMDIPEGDKSIDLAAVMVPQEVQAEDVVIVESHRINATSFNVTYDSGESDVISLVDDGTMRYWWYPPLAGYPLRTDIKGDDIRVIQTVEEWR